MIFLVAAVALLCFATRGDESRPALVFAIPTLAAYFVPLGEGGFYLMTSTCIDFGIIFLLSKLPTSVISINLAGLTLFSLAFNGACYFAPSMVASYSIVGVAFYLIALAVIITGGGHGLRNSDEDTWFCRHANECS